MSSNTKIVVLRMKELIYTAIFAALGILLLILLVYMFAPEKSKNKNAEAAAMYVPGMYTASIILNGTAVDIAVTVDESTITSIEMLHVSEVVETMYPLMEPALEQLSEQIYKAQSLDNITYPEENQYTSLVILDAIQRAIDKAKIMEPVS